MDGAGEAAIPHFERAINPEESADASFKWSAYVRATLAFLRHDREELAGQRETVSRGRPRGGRIPNLDVVDRLLGNIGESVPCRLRGAAENGWKHLGDSTVRHTLQGSGQRMEG